MKVKLVQREIQWEIEWRDGADHTQRLANGHRHPPFAAGREIHRDNFASQILRRVRCCNESVDGAVGFCVRFFDRLAGLRADELR